MLDKIRVLVVDDHAVVRHGLRAFLDLQPDITVVGEAADGAEAVERAKALAPDVALMDLVMAGMGGIEATAAVREVAPGTRVLVLTSFAGDEQVVAALRAGAAGYLMKDVPPEALAEAVRTVHRGDPLLHPEAARILVRQLSETRRQPEGTVTILITDIEASTALVTELGDERARAICREHDQLLRDALARYGGIEVKHQGDGLMAAFSSARRAVLCAIDMQRAIARHSAANEGSPLRVRIGLNTGEVIAEERDYFGETVILASRIAGKARGGQILVSQVTKALVGAGGVDFADCGRRALKGLGGHRLYEVRWADDGR